MNPEHHAELQSLLSDVAQSSQNYNFSDVEQSVETILKFDVIPLVKAVEPVDQPEQTVPSVKDEKTAKKRPVETALKRKYYNQLRYICIEKLTFSFHQIVNICFFSLFQLIDRSESAQILQAIS